MNHKFKEAHLRKFWAIAFSAVIAASGFSALPVGAQEQSESLLLTPPSRKYQVDPGQVIADTFKVVNDGKTAYDLVVYSRPYSVNNAEYEPNFSLTPANADAYKWVQFPKTLYHLEPGATQVIDFSMKVPTQANAGGHYGVIFAETQPTGPPQGTSVLRKKRLGMIVYATVKGDYKSAGEAVGADVSFWQVEPPLRATVSAKNTGNADFDSDVTITVKDMLGTTKYTASKKFTLLPQTTRNMTMDWTASPWFGLFKIETQQTLLGKKTTTDNYVLMMPRYLPVIFIVMLLVGGIYAWYRRRR